MEEVDKEPPVFFRGICRACIKKNSELFPLFGGAKIKFGDKCFTISEILFLGGRVKTNSDDKLPKHVCRKCLTRLIEIFSFQLKCLESDVKLKSILSKHEFLKKNESNSIVKDINSSKEPIVKLEKLDVGPIADSSIEFEKSVTVTDLNEITNSNNKNNKGSISDIVFSILEDKDQQVSVSMTVTLNDKNQPRQVLENRSIQEIKDQNINCISNNNNVELNINELKNKIKNEIDSEKKQGKFVCTFCKESFDTWSDLGKHIAKHKIQNNYGRLRSESPAFEVSSEIDIKENICCNICSKEFNTQDSYDLHVEEHRPYSVGSSDKLENEQVKDIRLSILSEKEMPSLTPSTHLSYNERFHCDFCPANYKHKKDVKRHLREKHWEEYTKQGNIHKEPLVQQYKCLTCGKSFYKFLHLQKHLFVTHNIKSCEKNKNYRQILNPNYHLCQFCDFRCIVLADLRRHFVKYHKKEIKAKYSCTTCGKNFRKYLEMVRHKRSHLRKTGKKIDNSSNVVIDEIDPSTEHEKYNDIDETNSNEIFVSEKNVADIEQLIENDEFDQANNNKISDTKIDGQQVEEKPQTEEMKSKKFSCSYCSLNYCRQDSLTRHIKLKHKNRNKKKNAVNIIEGLSRPLKCKHCSAEYFHEKSLQLHQQKKHPKTISESLDNWLYKKKDVNKNKNGICNECSTCKKTFLRHSSLVNHIKTHNFSSSTLNNSSRSNETKVAPSLNGIHKCLICPSIFGVKGGLQRHTKNHHVEKIKEYAQEKTKSHLYQCTNCYKWFITNANLKIHLRRHHGLTKAGVEALKCDICQKIFKNSKDYGQHLGIHRAAAMKSKRYCKECLLIFPHERGYKMHMVFKHKSSS